MKMEETIISEIQQSPKGNHWIELECFFPTVYSHLDNFVLVTLSSLAVLTRITSLPAQIKAS